jgi:hypothetical protein
MTYCNTAPLGAVFICAAMFGGAVHVSRRGGAERKSVLNENLWMAIFWRVLL